MAKKRTSGLRECIATDCKVKLKRAQSKYAKQYCEDCLQAMNQLRRLRQPCAIVGCKNPAHEDGYCDSCRPFSATNVPFRMDWLRGENLLKNNTPICLYTRQKPEGKTYRLSSINSQIEEIRRLLNE